MAAIAAAAAAAPRLLKTPLQYAMTHVAKAWHERNVRYKKYHQFPKKTLKRLPVWSVSDCCDSAAETPLQDTMIYARVIHVVKAATLAEKV